MAKYLVTSALPYANGPIHFGHIAGAYLPADLYVRYLRMRGHDVLYVCGTDEHGVAITLRAEQEGVSYSDYVDRWHIEIRSLFDRFGIDFNIFSGTGRCPYHADASQQFFRVLVERGWILERTEKQWFSEESGRFLPDRYLQGTCPSCAHEKARGDECPSCGSWIDARELGDPVSLIDGSRPVLRDTKHWYLDLPKFKEHGLGAWFAGDDADRPHAPWKPSVQGQVKAMFEDIRERPITRDLPWGVPVPPEFEGAEGKVLYVWFDAPIGYVSATMEWAHAQGNDEGWRDWWLDPECKLVHFLGKDNIAFHSVVFPAMLMGQGDAWGGQKFVLPWAVPANEFYNLEGRKFSTSEGWYLDNDAFFEQYDADVARFHLILSAPETSDSEFTWSGFQSTNNTMLADKLGNLASRVLKFCHKRFENAVPASDHTQASSDALADADTAFAAMGRHLDQYEFKAGAKALMNACDALNRYFDENAPWKLVKSDDEADRALCATVLERCLAYLELISRRLAPFCPNAAARMRTMLGDVAAGPADSWGADGAPAELAAGTSLGEAGVLFAKIDDETIEAEVQRLRDALGETADA